MPWKKSKPLTDYSRALVRVSRDATEGPHKSITTGLIGYEAEPAEAVLCHADKFRKEKKTFNEACKGLEWGVGVRVASMEKEGGVGGHQ